MLWSLVAAVVALVVMPKVEEAVALVDI